MQLFFPLDWGQPCGSEPKIGFTQASIPFINKIYYYLKYLFMFALCVCERTCACMCILLCPSLTRTEGHFTQSAYVHAFTCVYTSVPIPNQNGSALYSECKVEQHISSGMPCIQDTSSWHIVGDPKHSQSTENINNGSSSKHSYPNFPCTESFLDTECLL